MKHIIDYDPLTAYPGAAAEQPPAHRGARPDPVPADAADQHDLQHVDPGDRFQRADDPGLSMFYDWQGMLLFQPSLRFVRDPWRFIVDYTTINSGVFRGEIGFVRDRSNVRFQVEYVL